jgi:hypothetical protein
MPRGGRVAAEGEITGNVHRPYFMKINCEGKVNALSLVGDIPPIMTFGDWSAILTLFW